MTEAIDRVLVECPLPLRQLCRTARIVSFLSRRISGEIILPKDVILEGNDPINKSSIDLLAACHSGMLRCIVTNGDECSQSGEGIIKGSYNKSE